MDNWISINDKDRQPSPTDIDNAPRQKGWIACIPVLVTDGKQISDGFFDVDYVWYGDIEVKEVALHSRDNLIYSENITHWMPMPALPEEETT